MNANPFRPDWFAVLNFDGICGAKLCTGTAAAAGVRRVKALCFGEACIIPFFDELGDPVLKAGSSLVIKVLAPGDFFADSVNRGGCIFIARFLLFLRKHPE